MRPLNFLKPLFGLFFGNLYPISLQKLTIENIFPSYIYRTPQVMFGLVNNHGK